MDIEEYYDKIYRYCYYKVGNKTLAEDLTQETFLKFINSACTQPEHYLYTIARNLCIDEFRKKKFSSLEDEETEPSEDGFEKSVVERELVANALARLSDEDRELMILRFVNDEPLSEICKVTGLSRFALYRKINAAKAELVKYLEGK